jgi:hypothetical protein
LSLHANSTVEEEDSEFKSKPTSTQTDAKTANEAPQLATETKQACKPQGPIDSAVNTCVPRRKRLKRYDTREGPERDRFPTFNRVNKKPACLCCRSSPVSGGSFIPNNKSGAKTKGHKVKNASVRTAGFQLRGDFDEELQEFDFGLRLKHPGEASYFRLVDLGLVTA